MFQDFSDHFCFLEKIWLMIGKTSMKPQGVKFRFNTRHMYMYCAKARYDQLKSTKSIARSTYFNQPLNETMSR